MITSDVLPRLLNIIKNNRKWILRKSQYDTSGWCAVSAIRLNRQLKTNGFKPQLVLVAHPREGCHCFNILDEKIIDVTCDQFQEARIVFKDKQQLPEKKHHWFWGWKTHISKESKKNFSVITNEEEIFDHVNDWDKCPQEYLPKEYFHTN